MTHWVTGLGVGLVYMHMRVAMLNELEIIFVPRLGEC
jgi:hypothetical protein